MIKIASYKDAFFIYHNIYYTKKKITNSCYLLNCGDCHKVFAFSQLITTLRSKKDDFGKYKEANGIKTLCPTTSDYTSLCNFLDQLSCFYDYE